MKAFLQSPVGVIEIRETNKFISSVKIVPEENIMKSDSSELLEKAMKQLKEYFAGERKVFDLPLKQSGTSFQQKAWDYLSTIPYGQTVSYKEEAVAIGSPKGARAVGAANGKNNLVILVPCHRVVSSGGELGGYAYGVDTKQLLLDLENHYISK